MTHPIVIKGGHGKHWSWLTLAEVMAWCGAGYKPLPEIMLIYCQCHIYKQTSVKFESKYKISFGKCISKCCQKMVLIFFRPQWVHEKTNEQIHLRQELPDDMYSPSTITSNEYQGSLFAIYDMHFLCSTFSPCLAMLHWIHDVLPNLHGALFTWDVMNSSKPKTSNSV